MNSLSRGPNELTIGSSILTRRGGTDANAPERLRAAILPDWHAGISGLSFLGFLEMHVGLCGILNYMALGLSTKTYTKT